MARVVMGEERNLQLREHIVADIIERACGQAAVTCGFSEDDALTIYHAAAMYTELAAREGSSSDRDAALNLVRLSDKLEETKAGERSSGETARQFCEGCDHGVVNGKVCELCGGTGYKERRRSCGETAWVSVEEGLPETGWVQTFEKMTSGGIRVRWFCAGKFLEISADNAEPDVDVTYFVTHWAVLPLPPTGRANAEEKQDGERS